MNLDTDLVKNLTEQYNKVVQSFENLFYIDPFGEQRPRPEITIEQVRNIKNRISEIKANYKRIFEEYISLKKREQEVESNSRNVRALLMDFSKEYDVELPKFFKDIYQI